ncbi:FKBP-type peptidyl-prolyl cis-trans isomerase [Arcticibacterium luteifluviistationis]|uniref:Peptidyl-prolyl cis-trans isomerase n=1 Tax=Arcticibacterium luteifluviistationis TaxID=1784714 RepID=A0A2Z4GAI6_9BACT|nr:FKBP-type peptidyl-prolyl cis-trans isomerase [Arcticibacterium luteifluviistationis]AWV98110.1 peptidylprolyl isomerase [Arcticibacterium luteifluviistationis]
MSKPLSVIIATILLFNSVISNAQVSLNSELDSLSYAIGVNIGESLKAQNVQPTTEILNQAIKDVLNGSQLTMESANCGAFIQNYFQKAASKVGNENLAAGNAFLEKNKTREGVLTTGSGLQYEILTQGTGEKPLSTQKVKVHYHGTLIDGTVFDSSVERGSPATFGVTQVIKGWVEGLQLMPVGSKWKFYIPADLAYGPRGQGKIAPNSALIFEVELLEIL